MDRLRLLRAFTLLAVVCAGLPARLGAQELAANETEYVSVEGGAETAPAKLPDGLHPALTLGANLNLSSNSSVVGQVDGLSLLTGASIAGELHFIAGIHNWRNRLSITEGWSKTPTLDRFVKSNDLVDLESLYRLFLWPMGGMYARANLVTSLFPTDQITSDPATYVLDGDPDVSETTRAFDLADPFQPLTINESIGAFLDPVQEPDVEVSLRAGFGGRHTLAEGARLITNGDDPDAIVYESLEDVHQAGLELFAGVGGRAVEDLLSYEAGLVALIPFINNDDSDRSALDLARIALHADLTVSVFAWMGLSYQLRVVDDPQLVDDVQVQNNLLVTLAYTLVDKPEPPEEPDPLEAELEAQRARADAAEARAREAEARAAILEQGAGAGSGPAVPAPAVPVPAPAVPSPGAAAPAASPAADTPPQGLAAPAAPAAEPPAAPATELPAAPAAEPPVSPQ